MRIVSGICLLREMAGATTKIDIVILLSESICSHSSCSYCGSVESVTGSESEGEENEVEGERREESEDSPKTRPDIVVCSSSSPENNRPANPSLSKTTYREPSYIPPLPLPSGGSSTSAAVRTPFQGSSHQRMFIPKPQLTVSHHKSSSSSSAGGAMARHRIAAAPMERKILFSEAPPLPNVNYDRSVNEIDLDDFVYDYVPKTASKRVLSNHLMQAPHEVDQQHPQYQMPTNGGLRRDYLQGNRGTRNGEHMVIDIFPKPGGGVDIDQTLGIPSVAYDGGGMKTNLSRQPPQMHLNPLVAQHQHHQQQQFKKTERTQVVHQYPLISGQIPAVGGELNKFSVLMSQPRPFNDGPPVVQPSAMASNSGGGAATPGTSSNSSKSSGEKNKVKFSETITVAVLPEIPRKEKPIDHRGMMKGGSRGGGASAGAAVPSNNMKKRMMYTDPRRELAESLPLCHPNEDYLKDFQPAASNEGEERDY